MTLYEKVATLADLHDRQLATSLSLASAVYGALRASVTGSSSPAQLITQNAVAMDSGMRNNVSTHIEDAMIKQEAINYISLYVSSLVNKTLIDAQDRIDSDLQPNQLNNLTETLNTLKQEMKEVFVQIEEDRVNRIATGGKTARAQGELGA